MASGEVVSEAVARVNAVPFMDLHAQYLSIKAEIDEAIAEVIARSAFIRGPYVEAFEEQFAAAVGVPHCVSCANGTDALYIAMRALGLKAGDEVITTAHSWISTAETITQAGGKVVFCDTDRDTFTIDVRRLADLITPRTVGIIPVHLYGQPADMDPILDLAARHGLWVIEDTAQAHLARYKGRMVGTFGTAATFSFYPGKNLGAFGDAGAIVTRDAALASGMARFARHGALGKHDHEIEGINSRLDGLQAAILSVKLAHLPAWTRARRALASAYDRELAAIPAITRPAEAAGREHVYHLYVVRHEDRDGLAGHLTARGVQSGIHYPVALPFLKAYAYLGHRPEDFPNAFYNQSRILSLPMYPEMSPAQRAHVVAAVGDFCARRAK
ncbi:MAG TPA: DegT/DnrJ/EryC1/StrS family aminotransferase [Hyphomicrobiaceae bacterium]|nr:DegT/DnrJ/EryC1/StrS family aminotransferase [Hyphomicrobiaceae bacterium]